MIVYGRGNTVSGGLQGQFGVTVDLRTGRYVANRNYDIYTETDGFDGRLDWVQDRSGASHFLDSRSARAISVSQRWLRQRGWCKQSKVPLEISQLPDSSDSGVPEVVFSVTPRNGVPVILRFNRSDGLVSQSEIRLPFNRLIRHYSNWRDIGNRLLFPMTELDDDPDDESVETIELTSAVAQKTARAAIRFARPARPHDYSLLGTSSSTTVAYEDDGIGRIYVPAYINGKGPFPFEVDTGGHLRLELDTTARVGLSAVGSMSNTGGGTGIAHAGLVRIDELRIGQAVIHNQVASVPSGTSAANDRGPRPPRAGLLGLELFERFAVQLDRTAKSMTLTPLESFRMTPKGRELPIRFNEDAPLVAGTFEGIAGEFELDSGNAGPAIVEGFWAQEHGLGKRLNSGIEWSGSGVGGDYENILSRGNFTLGPFALPREVVSYVGMVERGSESTQQQAGVIGESSLYRFDISYDYGREQVWMSPNTTIPVRPFSRAGMRVKRDSPQSFVITTVVPDSAAQAAGLQSGDRILAVNGRSASELAASDVLVIASGPVGAEVEMSIVPHGGTETQTKRIRLQELLP